MFFFAGGAKKNIHKKSILCVRPLTKATGGLPMTIRYPSHLPHALEADTTDPGTSDLLCRLQQTMHADIPLTGAIGICAVAYDREGLRLSAPLAQNINDKGTVFSGSLNAVLTLAGWGLIWLLLREQRLSGAIVIQDSTIKYLQPVRRDFVAHGHMPEHSEIEQFRSTLHKRGRARLAVLAQIGEDDALRVTFTGRYVVDLHRQCYGTEAKPLGSW
jgi:thioesterase domain-containing protein